MIVVMADDLAGAAEMGGMAWRHGLTAEIQLEVDMDRDVDLIVVDTNTRSCTAKEAARRVRGVAHRCRERAIKRVYKKVDSVLRGQVAAELAAWLEVAGQRRVLLVPANPGLGRVIRGGCYYVNGLPLHETDFSRDPEYPATTSDVLEILGPTDPWTVEVRRPGEEMPHQGIVIGEAAAPADLTAWATVLDEHTLSAGASEFFGAFLRVGGFQRTDHAHISIETSRQTSALFVCGSTSSYSRSLCARYEAQGIPVLRMPPGLFAEPSPASALVQEWADAALRVLKRRPWAMVAIDRPLCREPGMPERLSRHLSTVVEQVLSQHPVDHLFVEGGATAAAVVRRLGWKTLTVCQEWATGVVSVRMRDQTRPLVTMKPGSYVWPDEVLPRR
jgi:uncharacterized protein YgbK (DUF1537 family)